MKEIMENYYLRPVELSDAKALFEFSSNENVTKYLSWVAHKDINETLWAIKNIYFKNEPISNAIVNSDNVAIGIIDFMVNSSGHKEIGYFLNPKYHRKGIMTNALKKMLVIGFNELGYETIQIGHIKENLASKGVIIKNGFKYLETVERTYKGKKYQVLQYEMKGIDFNEQS